jgi:hypothetical protein
MRYSPRSSVGAADSLMTSGFLLEAGPSSISSAVGLRSTETLTPTMGSPLASTIRPVTTAARVSRKSTPVTSWPAVNVNIAPGFATSFDWNCWLR